MKNKKSVPTRKRPLARETDAVTPLQALQFLEDVRVLYSSMDEATSAISLRVPENILRLLKTRAAVEGKKYQSLIIQILRESLKPR